MATRINTQAATALLAAGMLCSGVAMAIEEPAFEVIEKAGPIELRRYAPYLVAETVVDGDLDAASNRGFRLIADYIFGNNRSVTGADGPEKIPMTAPVTAVPAPASEKIEMTAPVLVEPQGGPGAESQSDAARWRIQFAMPRKYTLATLPRPNNPAIALREVPGARYAVLVFSGLAGQRKVRQVTDELLAWLDTRGLKAVGAPQLARYNPPWTLPFMRRNEVLVRLAE